MTAPSSTLATINASISINLTATGTSTLSQSAAGTSLFSPTINLNAATVGTIAPNIGISNFNGSTSPINLTARDFQTGVYITAAGPVNLVGASQGAVFELIADGNITIATGATITSTSGATPDQILLDTVAINGTITQASPSTTTTLFSPNVILISGTAATANIGTSATQAIGINSGIAATPVNLMASGGG